SSHMTRTGGLVGTPNYMSPEQITGSVVDARADIFAAGAVLYEFLSGVRPFEGDSVTALLFKIVQAPHDPLRSRAPHLPAALIDIVERALAKNPDDRPATALEMRAALLAALSQLAARDSETIILPVPASAAQSAPYPSQSGSESEAKVASLALDHGRELRKTGDLGAAMKVMRSVLEIAPGNEEAAQQIAELEEEIAAKLASSPARAQAPAGMPVAARPPTHGPVEPSPRAPVAAARGNRPTGWLIAAAIVVLAAAVSAVLVVRARRATMQAPPAPIAPRAAAPA